LQIAPNFLSKAGTIWKGLEDKDKLKPRLTEEKSLEGKVVHTNFFTKQNPKDI
jgi:hypothetical protein